MVFLVVMIPQMSLRLFFVNSDIVNDHVCGECVDRSIFSRTSPVGSFDRQLQIAVYGTRRTHIGRGTPCFLAVDIEDIAVCRALQCEGVEFAVVNAVVV